MLFALLASAALMVKGNGAALALLPPLAILIGRRFYMLRQWSFWIPIPIVAVLAGPWYVLTYGLIEAGFRYSFGFDYAQTALAANSRIIIAAVGPLLVAAGIIGFLRVVAAPPARRGGDALVGAAALLAAVFLFQCLVPAGIQDRYLAPALPPLLILALFGLDWVALGLAEFWGRKTGRVPAAAAVRAVALALGALSFLPSAVDFEGVPQLGFREAAREMWRDRIGDNPAVLVAADGSFEEAAIAALASLDPHRPSLFAVRGARLLGGGGYNNADYLPRFRTPAEVMAEIDRFAIPYVMLHSSGGSAEWAHLHQLEEARKLYPERWRLIYRDAEHRPEVLIFRIVGNGEKSADPAMLSELSRPRHLDRQ
jgi:hypothetical protein